MVAINSCVYSRILNGGLLASLDRDRLPRYGGDMGWQCHIAMTNAHFVMSFMRECLAIE